MFKETNLAECRIRLFQILLTHLKIEGTGASLTIWASAEPAATIAAASIPVLRVLFKKNKTKSAKTTETPHTDPPTQESGLTQATEHIISDKEIALDRPRDEEHGLGKTWFESRTPDNVTPSAN